MVGEADEAHRPERAGVSEDPTRPPAVRSALAPGLPGDTPQGRREAQADWDAPSEDPISPLTRADAERLFGPDVGRPSRVTPMRVVAGQVVLTCLAALICALLSQSWWSAALSALIGGTICWVPSGAFALYLGSRGPGARGQGSVGAWMVAEGVKLGVTIALFIAVAVYFRDVRWLPLLVTYVLALKTYWLALAWR